MVKQEAVDEEKTTELVDEMKNIAATLRESVAQQRESDRMKLALAAMKASPEELQILREFMGPNFFAHNGFDASSALNN